MASSSGFDGGGGMFVDQPLQEEPVRVCLRLRPVNEFELSRRSNDATGQTAGEGSNNSNSNNGRSKMSYAAIVGKEQPNQRDGSGNTNNNGALGAAAVAAAAGGGGGGEGIKVDSPLQGEFNFVYDKLFREDATQSAVYQQAAAPLASHALEGFNCALIAYGQTGTGKSYTMMGAGVAVRDGTATATANGAGGGGDRANNGKPHRAKLGGAGAEKMGMIHLLVRDVFRLIKESPPTAEYIVRCSFVEIYLEKVLDLLNPVNRSVQILSDDGDGDEGAVDGGGAGNKGGSSSSSSISSSSGGARIEGASEACCFDESDVVSLLVRGNACRTVSSTKLNTDSSRSHAVFVVKIEQKDGLTGISKASQLTMIDLAGSELGGRRDAGAAAGAGGGGALHQEARMINKSLSLLNTVVKTVVENQSRGRKDDDAAASADDDDDNNNNNNRRRSHHQVPYKRSKLTHLLRDAFGGNCRTSVILAASPASYNVSESIRTMKFGHFCRNVVNHVKPSVEMSPLDYRKLLNDSQKKQGDLVHLVNGLAAECFQLKQDARKENFAESNYDGPLWKTIETILVNGASPASSEAARGGRGTGGDDADAAALREQLSRTRGELDNSRRAREGLESLLAERQSEVAVLRTQNDNYASEKKRDARDLVAMRNEIRSLTQRKQEVEHNLRTSQFREYEATVFLRQFRRFYRRLLRNKAHQGTGRTSEVIERVPGVPDLNDLIDVDSLLLEAGLIEDSELHDDTATGAYRPSAQALGRSTDATNKAWKEAAMHGKVDELESFDRSSLEGQRQAGDAEDAMVVSAAPRGQAISNRQQFLGTPAGRLTTMRERELERDLLRATERCIELQVALNEEKANVDILANRSGNSNIKKFAQESVQLNQQLDKKTHDLQAIIWKMNELHLINKTYNEKMSNREQHVTYLEENLVELQTSNRNMILERQEAEGYLREELENLKVLVDAMTVPLWQFGECGVTGRTMASRIRLPVCGGDFEEIEEGSHVDDEESLESLEESVASYEEVEHDEDDESEYENEVDVTEASAQQVQVIAKSNVQMLDATTQTSISSSEKETMTDAIPAPQLPPSFNSHVLNKAAPLSLAPAQPQRTESTQTPRNLVSYVSNGNHPSEEFLFYGGKPALSQPRRFVPKFGLMIRPGVLKESSSKAKSERGGRSANPKSKLAAVRSAES